jgi:uncharacterized protein (DUF983 family)
MAEGYYPPVSILKAGILSRCPRCGRGKLFDGYLSVAEICNACSFELKKHDSGDGPAVFVMFIIGAIVVALALWVELSYEPPYWLHVVLWAPAITIGSLVLLRPAKATLIALQYRNKAVEYGSNPE